MNKIITIFTTLPEYKDYYFQMILLLKIWLKTLE